MQTPSVFNLPGATFTFMAVGEKWPPIIPAKGWQLPENGHTFEETLSYYGNVGFRAGAGYIGLDLDDPAAFEGLSTLSTTTWQTRPGRFGKLFTGTVEPEVMEKYGKPANHSQFYLYKGGLQVGEIKLERCYQVIPTSWKILEDGSRVYYSMVDDTSPAPIDLDVLMDDILALPGLSLVQNPKNKVTKPASEKPVKCYMPVKASDSPIAEPNERSVSYYALAALLHELNATEKAPASTRFNQVYRSGCALGEFVGAGLLPEGATLRSLIEAGETSGLSRYEAAKSARNGIAKGKKNPRRIPEP